MNVSLRRSLAACLATAAVAACTNTTAPPGGNATISITGGNNQTDTVDAVLAQSLVVHVAGGIAGAAVHFSSVSNHGGFVEAFVSPLSGGLDTAVTVSLDSSLSAAVRVQLGAIAGSATVVIHADGAANPVNARFTVNAGAPVALASTDTAIYIGTTATLHATLVDRHSNPIATQASYSVVGGPASVANNIVTSNAFGTALVGGSASGFGDTTRVSMVPHGTLAAASDSSGIVIFNLDGSGFRRLTPTTATFTQWAPSGAAVVFDQAGYLYTEGNHHGGIHIVDTTGTLTSPDSSRPATIADYEPQFSHDGTWIYFVLTNAAFNSSIWRMHPDGTGADSLAGAPLTGLYEYPATSAGDTLLTYDDGLNVFVQRIGSAAPPTILFQGRSARWSPTAAQLAYNGPQQDGAESVEVFTVGTGSRQVGSTMYGYDPSPNWSPDGAYIVVRAIFGRIDVIDAASGEAVQLPFTGALAFPSWRPTPTPAHGASTRSRSVSPRPSPAPGRHP